MIINKIRNLVINKYRNWVRLKNTSDIFKSLGVTRSSLNNILKINQIYNDQRSYNQSENFDDLLFYKIEKLRQKHKISAFKKVYLSELVFKFATLESNMSLFSIDNIDNPFDSGDVIIVNNNDIFQVDNGLNKYLEIYRSSPNAIFIIWDFDNHHNIKDSCLLSLSCDFYIPAHNINFELLHRFNPNFVGHIIPCVVQWSRSFLIENSPLIMNTVRSNEPLGMHIKYDKFPVRNRNIKRLNGFYNSISFVDSTYHSLSAIARLEEWSAYKLHWIIPTYNDVPSRMFDALATGGIPIVPDFLRPHLRCKELEKHVIFYKWEDLKYPKKVVDLGLSKFDEQGKTGLTLRHEFALNNCHLDQRIQLILERVSNFLFK